jgi:glycosyltransferase involved in cell wall biosynthesis
MPPSARALLDAGRRAADAVVGDRPPSPAGMPAAAPEAAQRVVLVLPLPIDTGGMRVLVDFADVLGRAGLEVHLRQVRGNDCTDGRYRSLSLASRLPLGGPQHLSHALRALAPAILLVGGWMDYFTAVESGAGPVLGYSAGEAVLYDTAPFDPDLVAFVDRMHRLPVTLLAGSRYVQQIYRERFGRESFLVSVPIAREMFETRRPPAPSPPPFRILVIGPEHNQIKGIPGALEALSALRGDGFRVVWVSPGAPSARLAALADEVLIDLDATQVAETIAASHVLVFPSSAEGLGNPPLEAMALGVPSVLCPNRGSGEYARPGENCLMVPHGDAESLRAAVRRLRQDPELASRIGRNGVLAADAYRPERVHGSLVRFLRERGPMLPCVSGSINGHESDEEVGKA